jgi:sulfoxide reductase heme-binding subunit YedZ
MRRHAKPLLFVLCALPLAWLLARAFGIGGLGLGANPIDELMDQLGGWGLRLLLATLCVRPLAVVLRKPWLMGLRRMLGLYAFTYLCLHFLNWLVLDQWFDLVAIAADIAERPYITLGFTGFVLLVPLAVTSTAGWMRRLGRRWHALHRLVYVTAILGCTHFWWQVKADWREPAAYSALLAVLLGWRLVKARQASTRPAPVPASARP